jgi:hypothetical protein
MGARSHGWCLNRTSRKALLIPAPSPPPSANGSFGLVLALRRTGPKGVWFSSPSRGLFFFAQSGSNGAAGPVYLSLSWLAEQQTWAAGRMLSDVWLALRTPF